MRPCLSPAAVMAVALAVSACGRVGLPELRENDLQKAIKAQDVEAVRAQLDSGANLGTTIGEPASAWELALRNLSPSDPRTLEIARLVLARNPVPKTFGTAPAPPSPANATFAIRKTRQQGATTYTSPVEIAAHQWSPEGVRLLLDNGLAVRSQPVSGALVHAAANGCAPVITMLLDAGAAVDGRDRNNDTPLAMARRVRNPQIVALLVGRGARAEAPKQSAAVDGAQNAIANILLGGPTPPPPGSEVVWIEGAEILAHPAGQAALKLAEAAPAAGPLPGAEATRRGIEAGGVLALKDSEAELHFVTFAEPGGAEPRNARETGTIKIVLRLADGAWQASAD